MLEYQGQLPFAAIADPEKRLNMGFGVEKMSPCVALDPRSWRAAAYALTHSPSLRGATGKGEEHMGLPAEFLDRPDGRVIAAKYGKFADDHWPVDELLALARLRARSVPTHLQGGAWGRKSYWNWGDSEGMLAPNRRGAPYRWIERGSLNGSWCNGSAG
jgi:hypothetical protein